MASTVKKDVKSSVDHNLLTNTNIRASSRKLFGKMSPKYTQLSEAEV